MSENPLRRLVTARLLRAFDALETAVIEVVDQLEDAFDVLPEDEDVLPDVDEQ